MTTLHEAAQAAIPVLEEAAVLFDASDKCMKVLDSLREALAQQGQDWSLLEATQASLREHMDMVKDLQDKLAQQGEKKMPEYFAQYEYAPDFSVVVSVYRRREDATPEMIHSEALPKQIGEPKTIKQMAQQGESGTWNELTFDEIEEIADTCSTDDGTVYAHQFYAAVSAALCEKNAQQGEQQPVVLPIHETPEMHDAVMSVLYKDGATRCGTDKLWQAYRGTLLAAAPAAQPLTDEWIRERCNQTWVFDTVKQWVRSVEAAHGIGVQK